MSVKDRAIDALVLAGDDKSVTLKEHLGLHAWMFESLVYQLAREKITGFKMGYWDCCQLDNEGPLFMSYESDAREIEVCCGDDAVSVSPLTACLIVNLLAYQRTADLLIDHAKQAKLFVESHQQLLRFSSQRPDYSSIIAMVG